MAKQDKTTLPTQHEEWVCEECGNTTPVPNDTCPNCGGKMSTFDDAASRIESDEDDLENADFVPSDEGSTEDGIASLDQLRDEEESEDDTYINDNNYDE